MAATKLLVFGDSIAYGAWDSQGGWVARVKAASQTRWLQTRDEADQAFVYNLGVPGDTTDHLRRRLGPELAARTARDLCFTAGVLALGTNDLKRPLGGPPQVPLERYRDNLQLLGLVLKDQCDAVAFLGIPPVGAAAQERSPADVRAYEQVMAEVAESVRAVHIPLSGVLHVERDLGDDGVHPNDAGHEELARQVTAWLARPRTR